MSGSKKIDNYRKYPQNKLDHKSFGNSGSDSNSTDNRIIKWGASTNWFCLSMQKCYYLQLLMIFAGGIPLKRNGKVVGAIVVSGGSVEQDQAVAEAGAAAFPGEDH
ncbi:MAG: heme-binding protein [Nitrososphaeraceae archaeon]